MIKTFNDKLTGNIVINSGIVVSMIQHIKQFILMICFTINRIIFLFTSFSFTMHAGHMLNIS